MDTPWVGGSSHRAAREKQDKASQSATGSAQQSTSAGLSNLQPWQTRVCRDAETEEAIRGSQTASYEAKRDHLSSSMFCLLYNALKSPSLHRSTYLHTHVSSANSLVPSFWRKINFSTGIISHVCSEDFVGNHILGTGKDWTPLHLSWTQTGETRERTWLSGYVAIPAAVAANTSCSELLVRADVAPDEWTECRKEAALRVIMLLNPFLMGICIIIHWSPNAPWEEGVSKPVLAELSPRLPDWVTTSSETATELSSWKEGAIVPLC